MQDIITRYRERRRLWKYAKSLVHEARHVRHMREDVTPAADLDRLGAAEQRLADALRGCDEGPVRSAAEAVEQAIPSVRPARPHSWFRENYEIILVAFVVAWGIRTYFLQPFKIPTGSMQPTLYGIHYAPANGPALIDRFPLSLVSRAVFGRAYVEVRAQSSGTATRDPRSQTGGGIDAIDIGGRAHAIPRDLRLRVAPGEYVVQGQLLASGLRFNGDHIFVDKVRWNFRPPRRGEIMVFNTDGIQNIQPNTHYIKRLIGLPGETIGVRPPDVLVNGKRVDAPATITRIENRMPGFFGYQFAEKWAPVKRIAALGDTIHLTAQQFLGFGDNTRNSYDGRYWGPVPEKNMVGPALLVYWPFSERWGLTD